MATKPSGEVSAAPSAKPSPIITLVVVLLGVWLGLAGAGGVVYYLMKSGRLPLDLPAGTAASANGKTKTLTLEPILINLADDGGHAYLRLGVTLNVEGDTTASAEKPSADSSAASTSDAPEASAGKAPGEAERAVRDTVLTVLGRQTSAYLLGPDGKEHLKIELKGEIEKGPLHLKVKELYFTDFLVQI